MSRLIASCRHVRRIVRRPWKPGPPGTVLVGVAVLSVFSGPLWGQTEISNDRLITGILDHDSRVKDLDLDYELRTEGPSSDRPRIRARTWKHKGDLRYFLDAPGDDSDVMSWEHSYDGREARTLRKGAVPWPEGNIRREQPTFLTNAASVLHVMGRTSIDGTLLDALERGTARVRPEPEQIDGHECWVAEGNTPEEGMPDQPYSDRVYFRYWLDPACGFMPRRTEYCSYDEAGTLVGRIIAGDYRLSEVAPGIWLPVAMREEGLELKDGQWQSLGVNHWRVTRVAVNSGLRDEDLKVKFPPGTYVQDFPRPGSDEYEEYRIGADGSIDRGMQDLVRQVRAADRAGPEARGLRGDGRTVRWVLGGLVTALGIVGLVFTLVRSRGRSASVPRTKKP